ncbi:glucan endo-1,3-beta-glucosidase 4-like [Lycium barbarum]|uniref:glucan endo-1,3-beta-glucosidase 4-like n=1 Tax=Lycium ferocissimum TaxID=112874 RepID=UPI0028156AF2|nr:glucan endo-1,3-beta-glucosidase 4-like [Lycium ferocissimum]XP_060184693.1 glucan endo-1,3-beta-glucosidase 4-like [Lycium barbarum]
MSSSRCNRNLHKRSLMCRSMSFNLIKILVALLFFSIVPLKSEGQFHDWCIADEQTPDDELVQALNWACQNGADCTKIQENQPCYLPNTAREHASYAFNSYYQNLKQKGASCYFNSAAVLTAHDPSHDACKFEVIP